MIFIYFGGDQTKGLSIPAPYLVPDLWEIHKREEKPKFSAFFISEKQVLQSHTSRKIRCWLFYKVSMTSKADFVVESRSTVTEIKFCM